MVVIWPSNIFCIYIIIYILYICGFLQTSLQRVLGMGSCKTTQPDPIRVVLGGKKHGENLSSRISSFMVVKGMEKPQRTYGDVVSAIHYEILTSTALHKTVRVLLSRLWFCRKSDVQVLSKSHFLPNGSICDRMPQWSRVGMVSHGPTATTKLRSWKRLEKVLSSQCSPSVAR